MTTPTNLEPAKLNDLVMLREDIQLHKIKLTQGRIGCIREAFSPTEFEVEFLGEGYHREAIIRLNLVQISILRHEVTLDEEGFWNLVETAKADSKGDGKRQVNLLIDRVAQMSIADILAYSEIFSKMWGMAHHDKLYPPSEFVSFGGDDGFMDFSAWLVAQGKTIFYAVIRDPDTLADVPIPKSGSLYNAQLEPMNYVDSQAFEQKTGEEMPWFRNCLPLVELPNYDWNADEDEDWDRHTQIRRFPRLAQKYWPEQYALIDWSVPTTEKPAIMRMLDEEHRRWAKLLNSLSEETIIGPKLHGDWTIKDLVVHLWAWQQRSIANLEAALENREPVYPQWPTLSNPNADPETTDRTNAYIYETYRDLSWETVQQMWRDSFLRFIELAESIPENDLFDAEKYRWLEGYTLADVLKGSFEHHRTDHYLPLSLWIFTRKWPSK